MAKVGLLSTGRTRDALAGADLLVASLDELSPQVMRGLIANRIVSRTVRGSTPVEENSKSGFERSEPTKTSGIRRWWGSLSLGPTLTRLLGRMPQGSA